MSVKRRICCAATFAALLLSATAAESALRCGTRLITEGDRKIEVLKSCGEPTLVEHHAAIGRTVPRIGSHGRVSGTVLTPSSMEIWTYNFGPRRLMQVIRFNHGRVIEIISLGHGY